MWKPLENLKGKITLERPKRRDPYNVEELTTHKVNLQHLVKYKDQQ